MNDKDNHLLIRYVIALNNIGVTLLERHCYGQAADTFESALFVTGTALVHTDASPELDQVIESSSTTWNQRVAFANYQSALTRLSQPFSLLHEGLKLQTLSLDQHCPLSELSSTAPPGCWTFSVFDDTTQFLVRMNETMVGNSLDSTTPGDRRLGGNSGKPELFTAIIMHNLGVAFLALGLFQRSREFSQMLRTGFPDRRVVGSLSFDNKYQRKAEHVFRYAYSIYLKEMEKNEIIKCYSPEIILRGMIATLHGVIQSSSIRPLPVSSISLSLPVEEHTNTTAYYVGVLYATQTQLYSREVVYGTVFGWIPTLASAA